MTMTMTNDMKVKVMETTLVKPSEKTSPQSVIPLSELDLIYGLRRSTGLYFYKPNGEEASNFFDPALLKNALAKVLVPYYPLAGRFSRAEDDGRLRIDCNDEGVLLVVAKTSSVFDDLGDFTNSSVLSKLKAPPSDYAAGISSFPLLALQVTYFECGGVCLSVGGEHLVVDGASAFSFVKAWSEITRGQDISVTPIFERTLLRPGDPPKVMFDHRDEYQIMDQTSEQSSDKRSDNNYKVAVVKITRDQLNILKIKAKEDGGDIFDSVRAYVEMHVNFGGYFSADGRSRLKPPLPVGYVGSVVFQATTLALAGDLQSKPFWYAAARIHETLMRLDDEYLRSVIDFLKVNPNTKRIGLENV